MSLLSGSASQLDVVIGGKVDNLDVLPGLVLRVEPHLVGPVVLALVVAVPVVPRHADDVAHLQVNLVTPLGLVGDHGHLLVFALAAEVPDVVQGFEPKGVIRG